ncbi:hypothetical protein SNE40_001584 [Patella caerulea]|uniref:BAT2 N-terminal domain-containing protein n=1 Tax=Patella caerulea TaxID=87958 RepID=A0AAN8KJM9_PATCE
MFKEEFPTLAGDEKDGKIPKEGGTGEEKDVQYGPGPSLRPQNVGSWREGGGRGTSQQPQKGELTTSPSQPTANQTETQANGPQTPISVSNQSPVPPMPGRPGSTQGPPQGPLPMGPMGMPPPQYRGMMPPYMFGRNFPGPGFPPNYPGMPRPFPYDGRFQRGPPPVQNRPNNNNLVDEDGQQAMSFHRAAIITDKDLKNFDQILKAEPSDGGWAGAQGEIDYSAKLVFSDEEDEGSEKNRERRKRQQHHRQYDKRTDRDEHDGDYSDQHGERDRGDPRDRVDGRRQSPQDKDINQDKDNQGRDNVPRENWQGQMPPQFRGGQQRHPHPGMDARGWPMHPYDYPMRPPFPFRMAHPGQQRTNFGHPVAGPAPPPSQQASSPNKKSCEDDDELWQQRRKQSSDEVSAIVQRARQRREESEKKSEAERKAAAAEKLKQLDERSKKREEVKSEDEDKKSEGCISRTSESSEKDPRERIPSRDGSKHPQSNQGYNKSRNTVPPRFQKQQQEQMRQSVTTSQSPGTAGTHTGMPPQGFRQGPPPHWPYDMRAWASIPPFMDPRYGGRPPVDIQGMPMFPPQVRRRTDSHGSGADSQDDNRPSDSNFEQQQRDHRNWLESRGYPPPPSHPGAYDEMRRAQNFYMFQQEYERYEMERNSRDYDRQNTGEDDHESGASDHESINKDEEDHNCEGPREVFDDVNNDRTDKDDKTKEIPKDKSKEKDFEKKRDDSDDKEDDRWGSYRSARHASSPGSLRSYNSDERPSKNDFRRDNYPYCPPPMPQPQQPPPSRSNNYTSLKRSASNMSSSSNTSQDRKSDSPKDIPTTEKLNLHKEPNKVIK